MEHSGTRTSGLVSGFRQFRAIAALTTLETVRQPVCLLLLLACVWLIGLMPFAILHQFGEHGKLVRDSALALHFVMGLFVGGFAACSAVSKELRHGTAATILSKPVRPELFFLAKFAGIAATILFFSACALMATLMSERAAPRPYEPDWRIGALMLAAPPVACLLAGFNSYFTRRHFTSNACGLLFVLLLIAFLAGASIDRAGRLVRFGALIQWRLVPAGILVTAALLLLTTVAVSLSTRLTLGPTVSILWVVFLLGLVSDYLFGRAADHSAWAAVLHAVIPDLQHFWMTDALAAGGSIRWRYVLHACGYAALYGTGILMLGTVSLRHVEIRRGQIGT